ncbi:MAG: DNA polymerase III subunit delta' [Coriobacteriia bacterium]
MQSTRCVWDSIVAQGNAISLLRQAAESGVVSHAYLFVGPSGAGKKTAARAFACAVMCDDDGCGACDACRRIRRGAHPDVRVVEPQGAATYLVDQVRDLVHDIGMTPAEGPKKIYIVCRADAFNQQSANALLKTLEEPPEDTVLILLAPRPESVLPTIASRCQVVRFERIPPKVAVRLISEKTGVDEKTAAAALAAAGGVPARAVEVVASPTRVEARAKMLAILKDLSVYDAADVLDAAATLLRSVKVPLDAVREQQAAEEAELTELVGAGSGAVKELKARHKRELTAREREGLVEILNVAESWLRDCLAESVGYSRVDNSDVSDAIAEVAALVDPGRIALATRSVSDARRRISYNVSPQLALEAMLFELQEVFQCPQ